MQTIRMRTIRLIILFVVLLAGVGLIAATAGDQPAWAQGSNLLQNPGFEGGFYAFNPADFPWLALYGSQREDCKTSDGQYLQCNTAQVPAGWIPWWISQSEEDPDWKNRMPEYKPATAPFLNRIHSGSAAAQYFTFHSTHTAGLLQVVDVPQNASVRFSIWGQAWSSASDTDYSDFPTPVNMRIGIDPTGGTNPYNPAIVWSGYKQPYDSYQQFVVEAQAQGTQVTVFTISSPDEARKHNDVYWDDAELVVIGQAAPPPADDGDTGDTGDTGNTDAGSGGTAADAPPPSSSIGPTATPDAEGVIYAEVQQGDSFWSIAARHGLSIDEIYELNDAGEGDFVQPGQMLIVGYAEPATTEEEETETEAAGEGESEGEDEAAAEEEAALAAEDEPTATATPVPPTPTPEPRGGEICLKAFVDANQNGQHDAGERLKSAVAFTISNGEAVVSNYVTDGASEPYCITGLDAGNYQVTRSTTEGEVLTTSGDWSASVSNGGTQTLESGSYIDEARLDSNDGENEIAAATENDTSEAAAAVANAATAENGEAEGGFARIIVIAAVVVAVLLLVGVLVIILSARRSTA